MAQANAVSVMCCPRRPVREPRLRVGAVCRRSEARPEPMAVPSVISPICNSARKRSMISLSTVSGDFVYASPANTTRPMRS